AYAFRCRRLGDAHDAVLDVPPKSDLSRGHVVAGCDFHDVRMVQWGHLERLVALEYDAPFAVLRQQLRIVHPRSILNLVDFGDLPGRSQELVEDRYRAVAHPHGEGQPSIARPE